MTGVKKCDAPGCEKSARYKTATYCDMHDTRMRRHGSLNDPRPSAFDTFFARVEPNGDCWEWRGMVASTGYGMANRTGAHRVAYQLLVGKVPEGLHLDHLCRNKICVNPDHLEPVTPRENLMRGSSHVARRSRSAACDQGHAWTAENTYVWHGIRACRECRRIAKTRSRACAANLRAAVTT